MTCVGNDPLTVEVGQFKILNHDIPIDHRHSDVSSTGGEHQRRPDITVRRETWTAAIDEDEVGSLTRFDRSNFVLEPEGARAFASSHPDGIRCSQRTRRFPHGLNQRGKTHLFEHVEAVIARRAVGTQ